ncbi:hypothetical protein GCM10023170_025200 [Phytohabitans houttuyneae]|uniref:hypothetical protein n=1 Tax=Phytohabitans houttuyneae TaxID=1076126 RepID=UPI0031E57CFE
MSADVETQLRDSFTRDAEAVRGPADPWAAYTRREATHRRNRRLRAGALAAAVAALVGVQTNVVPLPGWAPGIAVAGHGPAFADVPTRGELAGDQAWLAGLRRQVKDIADPDGLWRVADRDEIHVVYAGDIPGRRLAIAHVRLRLGLIAVWERVYYQGPPGAAPEQMEESGNEGAESPVAHYAYGDDEDGGGALVVGPPDAEVAISLGFVYSPAGVVERRPQPVTSRDGVAAVALPASPNDPNPYARVTVGDKVIFEGGISSGWSSRGGGEDPLPAAALAKAREGARGTPIDAAVLTWFVGLGFADCRVPASEATLRVLWSGQVNGAAAALFTIQPRGGGVIAYAMHGTADSARYDLRLLLPAEGAHTRPLAWRMRADGRDDSTDRVYVVAPPGAARVTVTAATGAPVAVALDAAGFGTGTVPPDQPAQVTAYAADGERIAATPVPPFERSMGDLPGATRGTRIVD